MKLQILLVSFLLVFFCSKNGESPEDNGNDVERIILTVAVNNSNNQPFTDGYVLMTAVQWLYHSRSAIWFSDDREESKPLDNDGEAEFIFGVNQINPDEPYVSINGIEIYNSSFEILTVDTVGFLMNSGEHRTVNFIIE